MRFTCLSIVSALVCILPSFAQLSMPAIFSDNMVLQQQRSIPLWGNANAGANVNVLFREKNYETKADTAGKWKLLLPAQRYGGPYSLSVASGNDSLQFENVMIGEVWLCSGQSNMEMPLEGWSNGDGTFRYPIDNAEQEIAAATFPDIRLVTIKDTFMSAPQSTVLLESKGWQPCSPITIRTFSSTAYFFAREIYQKTGVPIGLINSAYGGTVAEWWTPKEYLQGMKDFEKELNNSKTYLAGLYNAMIAPLIPYGIRGVIWYQGEFNAGRGEQYAQLFPRLIRSWRDKWQQGDFPFYYVQLPIIGDKDPFKNNWQWAELREAQSQTLAVKNTAMAVTIDLPDNDLHPRNKQDFGKRLALIPLTKIYKKEKHYSAPSYKSYRVKGSAVELQFLNSKEGLQFDGPTPLGFIMAGPDSVFHPATARIKRKRIIVTCGKVAHPLAVRYAWAGNPPNNLRSKAGLPVSPFRTDSWINVVQ